MAPRQKTLRLSWSRTWPDKSRDFVANSDGQQIGRIYLMPGAGDIPTMWHWTCYGRCGQRTVSYSGRAGDKQTAALAVESAWFDATAAVETSGQAHS
ncbi:hypothetical protein [Mesorhizobium sp. Z1-4]|uniref:hypothetical protein n=1 Tax=Mesorhizobium sp. Z1-4 TaxID=2448478 RepID=UPI000FDBF3F9|nr:hypothetical protein [Mesorhizobium sp. Z1-4]